MDTKRTQKHTRGTQKDKITKNDIKRHKMDTKRHQMGKPSPLTGFSSSEQMLFIIISAFRWADTSLFFWTAWSGSVSMKISESSISHINSSSCYSSSFVRLDALKLIFHCQLLRDSEQTENFPLGSLNVSVLCRLCVIESWRPENWLHLLLQPRWSSWPIR